MFDFEMDRDEFSERELRAIKAYESSEERLRMASSKQEEKHAVHEEIWSEHKVALIKATEKAYLFNDENGMFWVPKALTSNYCGGAILIRPTFIIKYLEV